ncbi:16S rRNA (guanine(527)-N(7))-methyltransferase RsmG [Uliginosibacterium sp. 31-16]|uniref:16S rRNA (guanine(527)-N(7))-methyltransferase RsmG n=1 Tax=Uliginosibacterium sp. 31-16 TaxID=3068315 RepID=UPI00273EE9C8|nr:16S rRNA (guanine(527)-N(7))-methyltransferase RsmG [Uliginosibacterium sp. 31-16]MDP5238898.1 16S rRNA (guanine(527)-N(7))-methyltransferase RsmG [Uliginosibacterium sp. 31-16]
MNTAQRLADGITALGLDLDERTQQCLLAYAALLMKWNKVYNLTAIRDEASMIDLHLLDSLAILPHVADITRVADIGAGGGLPGIPLAICRPDCEVALVETVGKKASFLLQAKAELRLANLSVHNTRVENLKPAELYPAVSSRAFASLADFITLTAHLVAPDGQWIAMKGVYPQDELDALPAGFRLRESRRLEVPGVDAERHLLFITRN